MKRHCAPLLLLAALSAPALAGGEEWFEDYDAAVEIARRDGKNLLVDFTGSDWCGWCIKLHDEVFQYETFLDAVTEDYVLVSLDFPRGEKAKAAVPNPQRNQELKTLHGVKGFPTVLLMTPDGEVFGRTGYQAGGAKPYVAHLGELERVGLADLRVVQELISAWSGAEGDSARHAALNRIFDHLDKAPEDSPFVGKMGPVLREALAIDDDEVRLRAVRGLARLGDVDAELVEAAAKLDPKNAGGVYSDTLFALVDQVDTEEAIAPAVERIDRFFAVEGLEKVKRKSAINLLVYGAWWNHKFLDDAEKAQRYARLALDRAPAGHPSRGLLNEVLR